MTVTPDHASSAPRIEMFSGPGCAYCAQTRSLLDAGGYEYVEYDVAIPAHLEEFGKRLPRSKALPQLFVDGEHIGSLEDLEQLAATGRLAELVTE